MNADKLKVGDVYGHGLKRVVEIIRDKLFDNNVIVMYAFRARTERPYTKTTLSAWYTKRPAIDFFEHDEDVGVVVRPRAKKRKK